MVSSICLRTQLLLMCETTGSQQQNTFPRPPVPADATPRRSGSLSMFSRYWQQQQRRDRSLPVGRIQFGETTCVKNTLTPEWNQEFILELPADENGNVVHTATHTSPHTCLPSPNHVCAHCAEEQMSEMYAISHGQDLSRVRLVCTAAFFAAEFMRPA